ncbi:hypothetical protein ACFW1M_30720 [Streptomyces inhibens]|uniref:hypothetical protein n=1 Tax=Streptomyces inhibens TaxID=2293571 RepID=UPI00367849C0
MGGSSCGARRAPLPPAHADEGSKSASASDNSKSSGAANASQSGAQRRAPEQVSKPGWSNTKQFMQIESGRLGDGQVYLKVRPARKKAVSGSTEGWQVVPGKGSYTEVTMTEKGRVLASAPVTEQPAPKEMEQVDFITRLGKLPAKERSTVGYDVTFDTKGNVTRVQSLYTP